MGIAKSKLIAFAVVAAGVWAGFGGAGTAHAATITWSGASCKDHATTGNCDWSNTANWQGGVVPANGDSVVIVPDAVSPESTHHINYDSSSNITLVDVTVSAYLLDSVTIRTFSIMSGPSAGVITVSGNVSLLAPGIAPPSGYVAATSVDLPGTAALVPTANVTYTDLTTASSNTLALGGHTVIFKVTGQITGNTFGLSCLISGNGVLTVDAPTNVVVYMNELNTYSGTTTLVSADYFDAIGDSTKMFGSSTINISDKTRVLFEPVAGGTVTINNVINVTPPAVTGTFLSNQLEFWGHGGTTNFVVPNIVLLGNARFGINSTLGATTVNLTGITTNGHCVQYGDNNLDATSFSNGPTACVVTVASTPNTGFAVTFTNPLFTLVASFVAGAVLILAGKKVSARR